MAATASSSTPERPVVGSEFAGSEAIGRAAGETPPVRGAEPAEAGRAGAATQTEPAGNRGGLPAESPGLVSRKIADRLWKLADRPFTITPSPTGSPLERGLAILGFVVAGLLISLFGLDLAIGWPFARHSLLMDAAYVACGGLLVYLSWNAYRDLR